MAPRTPIEELAAGQRIGPFVLLTPLGSGGSGRVWAAARVGQLGFTKLMALKVLRKDKHGSPRARERFEREARLGAQLMHPNVRVVHDLGTHEGRLYMAMRWVDTSLEELLLAIPGNKLQPDIACWLGLQCCAALGAAHGFVDGLGRRRPIIHRDVSPGNILLTAGGHVLLSDLAPTNAPTGPSEVPPGTGASRFFGNLRYAAPEALKEQALDGRADIFSLGGVLYEALSGSSPFDADDEASLLFQVLEQGAPDLHRRAPELPARLVETVHRALARDASERFQSVEALAEALSSCIEQRNAFELEQLTTSCISEMLGAPLHAREEAMYAAFQRFSVSGLERTDTLPLHQSASPWQPITASNNGAVGAAHEGPSSRSDNVVAQPVTRSPAARDRRRIRSTAAVLALGLSLVMGVYWQAAAPPASTRGGELGTPPPPKTNEPPPLRERDAGSSHAQGAAQGGAPSDGSEAAQEPTLKPTRKVPSAPPVKARPTTAAPRATPPVAAPPSVPRQNPAPAHPFPASERDSEMPTPPPRIKQNPYRSKGPAPAP